MVINIVIIICIMLIIVIRLTLGNSGNQNTSVKTPLFSCFEFHFLIILFELKILFL